MIGSNDWVIFTILGLGISFWLMFSSLQREVSLQEFLLQRYSLAQNNFLSNLVITMSHIASLSVLFSQSLPIVPRWAVEWDISGFVLNKIGFMLMILSLFYLLKFLLTVLFYFGIGQPDKILKLTFVAQRFYIVESLFLVLVSLFYYYFQGQGSGQGIEYWLGLILLWLLKILFYLLHKDCPLPSEWYHKILYICTLQILPFLAVWKLLFL